MITCPSCNHQNEVGSSFCENCGHDLRQITSDEPRGATPQAAEGLSCPNCGHGNFLGAAFCENCGNPLQKSTSPSPAVESREVLSEIEEDQIPCSNCGHLNVPGSKCCENCGNPLKQEPIAAEPQISPQPPIEKTPEPPSQASSDIHEAKCSQCGYPNPAGTIFCGNCGVQLVEVPEKTSEPMPVVDESPEPQVSTVEPEPEPPVPTIQKPSGVQGRFEVEQSGASIPIPAAKQEVIIGREDPVSGIFPEIDLDPHGGHEGGVGRKHVRLFIEDGQIMVEDQDSVNGTFLNKHKLNAFQPKPLSDGDELRLGKIVLTYHAS